MKKAWLRLGLSDTHKQRIAGIALISLACILLQACFPLIGFKPVDASLSFSATAGGESPVSQSIVITNVGWGTLSGLNASISYGKGNGWLSASIGATTAPAALTVQATTGSLSADTYTATISVTGSAGNSPQKISVTFQVIPNPQASGSLQFGSATYSVNENGGSVSISVTRTGGSYGAVGVSYATTNGTATAGSDYSSKSGSLTWADGDTSDKSFSVSITNDSAVEGNETFTVGLSSPSGGATLGSPSTATVTIVDDETANYGTLRFGSATYSVNENGGSVSISVTRTGGSYGAVGVSWATAEVVVQVLGLATPGSDFVAG